MERKPLQLHGRTKPVAGAHDMGAGGNQWAQLNISGERKKLRCADCTRPIPDDSVGLVCDRCSAGAIAKAPDAVASTAALVVSAAAAAAGRGGGGGGAGALGGGGAEGAIPTAEKSANGDCSRSRSGGVSSSSSSSSSVSSVSSDSDRRRREKKEKKRQREREVRKKKRKERKEKRERKERKEHKHKKDKHRSRKSRDGHKRKHERQHERSIITGKRIKHSEGERADAEGEARRERLREQLNGDESGDTALKREPPPARTELEELQHRARFDPALMKELMERGHEAQRAKAAKRGKAPESAARRQYYADLLAAKRDQGTL